MAAPIIVALQVAGQNAYNNAMQRASAATGRLQQAGQSAGPALMAVGKAAGMAGVAVGAMAVKIGTDAVAAYDESYKIGKQTEAVIKSTGGAARVTADHIGDLAGKLSEQSGVDDELIQSGQNMLLTFKNVQNRVGKGNKIFDRASQSLLDMSVAMGKDPAKAAVGLGKALNDPIKGVSALGKVGVQFSKTQKKQIEQMVKHGRMASAQKMILRELESQFGGSAKAQATNTDRMKVAYGNLMEQLGGKLHPIVNQVAGSILKFGQSGKAMETIKTVGRTLAPIWGPVKTLFAEVWKALQPLGPLFRDMLPFVKAAGIVLGVAFVGAVKVLTVAVRYLAVGIRYGVGIWRQWLAVIRQAWERLKVAGAQALEFGKKVRTALSNALNSAKAYLGRLGSGFTNLGKSIVEAVVRGIKSAPGAIVDAVKGLIPGKLRGIVSKVLPFAKGGVTRPGTLSLVGENGPEIAAFPGGTRITPITARGNTTGALSGAIETRVFLNGREIALAVGDDVANRRARR